MPSSHLSAEEFDRLVQCPKEFTEQDELPLQYSWSRNLISYESGEGFVLDFRKSNIEVRKFSYNKRYRKSIVLLRFCSQVRHTNPDGVTFDGAHIHLYRDGFDDKFAFPVSEIGIPEDFTIEGVLIKILDHFNVGNRPSIRTSMF